MKSKKTISLLISIMIFVFNLNIALATVIVPEVGDGGEVKSAADQIIGIINIIAWAVAIGMMIIIGIKFMSKGAGAKAEVKSTFLPYFIGAICVGAATMISQFALTLKLK